MPTETLQEYAATSAPRVNREQGVVYDVKLLGSKSKNGRTYTEGAMRNAIPLYEGAKVNLNHPSDTRKPRDYDNTRFGAIFGVYYREGSGLFAKELRFNTKHPLAEQFCWDAENVPNKFGLSHNVRGRTTKVGAGLLVEEIEHVDSVDIVMNPATTNGLFESHRGIAFPKTHDGFVAALTGKSPVAEKLLAEPQGPSKSAFVEALKKPRWTPPTPPAKSASKPLVESQITTYPKDHKSFMRTLRKN